MEAQTTVSNSTQCGLSISGYKKNIRFLEWPPLNCHEYVMKNNV